MSQEIADRSENLVRMSALVKVLTGQRHHSVPLFKKPQTLLYPNLLLSLSMNLFLSLKMLLSNFLMTLS